MIQRLRESPGVELVLTRAPDGGARIFSRRGESTIRHLPDGRYAYACSASDPLGYRDSPETRSLCDGVPRTPAEWLRATYASAFPDAVVRVARLMTQPGAGDLVVTALKGFDLAADYELVVGNYRGGHGGLRADQLRVPYVIAGPGIARGRRVTAARAEDVGATLLEQLGVPPEPGAEGVPLH